MRLTTKPDGYQTPANTKLTVAAPGVLANDINLLGGSLTAEYRTSPTPPPGGKPQNGPIHAVMTGPNAFVFNSDGSFSYMPDTGYVGTDWFYYRARSSVAGSTPSPWTLVMITVGRAMIRQCAACTCNGSAVSAGVYFNGFLPYINQTDGSVVTHKRWLVKRLIYTNGGQRYDATITFDRLNGWWTYLIDPSTNISHPMLNSTDFTHPDRLYITDLALYTNVVYDATSFTADFISGGSVSVTMTSERTIAGAKADLDALLALEDPVDVLPKIEHSWRYDNQANAFMQSYQLYVWPGQIGNPGFKDSTPITGSANLADGCVGAYLEETSSDALGLGGRKTYNHAVGNVCEQELQWEFSGAADSYTCTTHVHVGGVCAVQSIATAVPELIVVDDFRIKQRDITLHPDSTATEAGPTATPCCP